MAFQKFSSKDLFKKFLLKLQKLVVEDPAVRKSAKPCKLYFVLIDCHILICLLQVLIHTYDTSPRIVKIDSYDSLIMWESAFHYRLERTGTFETRLDVRLELVWRVVEGPLLFETPVPISGRGKVEKLPVSWGFRFS